MRLSGTRRSSAAILVIVAACAAAGPGVRPGRAADHGDAPLASNYAAGDINDVYAFLDPNDNEQVVLIQTQRGFIAAGENANFGNFDPRILSVFELETTGDAQADFGLLVSFSPQASRTAPQTATITAVTLPALAPLASFTAPTTISSTDATAPPQTVTTGPAGIRFFAGMTDDPFFFDIPGFGRFVSSVLAGTPDPTQLTRARDSFAGYNTMAIAISFPRSLLAGVTTLGVGGRTFRLGASGQVLEQLDRMGVPAVNVALVPFATKEAYNTGSAPQDAAGQFASGIVSTLTALGTSPANIALLANLAVNNGDLLRLSLTTANTGPQGGTNPAAAFPNGRRVADDVIDTLLGIITNGAITTGDNVNGNDVPFQDVFPFLAPSQQPRAPGTIDDNTRN